MPMHESESGELRSTARRYISPRELSEMTGLARVTLAQWRQHGRGPAWIRLGSRVLYDIHDIESWMAARRQGGDAA